MSVNVTVPNDLWDGELEAVITNWLVNNEASVAAGDPVAEIMVEKAQFEIAAPASGKLRITANANDIISKGAIIGYIE